MIKAVFFDAIKTLFMPYPDETGLYTRVIKEITGKDIDKEKLTRILEMAMAETERLDAVKENSFQQWEHYPTIISRLIGCAENECKSVGDKLRHETWGNPKNYRLYDDVLPTLKALAEKDLYIACASNEDGWLSNFFVHFGIEKYFKFILTSYEVGYEKPNQRFFTAALSQTDFAPEEVLFVGDSLVSDYEGSKEFGMRPVLIDRFAKVSDNEITKITKLTDVLEKL